MFNKKDYIVIYNENLQTLLEEIKDYNTRNWVVVSMWYNFNYTRYEVLFSLDL